jgi:hypothetical protein
MRIESEMPCVVSGILKIRLFFILTIISFCFVEKIISSVYRKKGILPLTEVRTKHFSRWIAYLCTTLFIIAMIQTDIIIIGAGPVGLFTVFEAGLLKLHCHLIDSLPQPGGQCSEIYPK